MPTHRFLAATLAFLAIPACQAPEFRPTAEEESVLVTVVELYGAFCFDAEAQPDWEAQRRIYLESAVFVPPFLEGGTPRADDMETFLGDFWIFVTSGPYAGSGLYERPTEMDVSVSGRLAQAMVTFEGFLPESGEVVTRGVDSIHFIHDGERWRLTYFATEYETD